jgi:NADPH:quinone reductase-like Zn-dependent oxidoreductase
MKAQQLTAFGSTDNFALVEVDAPVPAPGQVLVRVHAIGFNPMEWKIRQGFMEAVFPTALPAILGSEIAGVVEALGDGVTGFTVGDRVVGFSVGGAEAELAVAQADAVAILPEGLSFEKAATLPVAVETAVRAIGELGVESGQTIVVNGAAGGVGTAAVQLLVRAGVTVVGTASERNQEYVASLGAVPVVYGEGVESRIREAAPQGVDGVFDSAGHGFAATGIALTGDPKRVITISDFEAASLGILLSTGAGPTTAERFATVLEASASGEFRTEVDQTFPLEDLAAAHALSEAGHVRGKIVVTV